MKHDELRSIAHNLVDSFAGNGFLVGLYNTEIFDEAGASSEGFLTVDFLTGTIANGRASQSLAESVMLHKKVLPSFCQKHGASISDFRELTVRFYGQPNRPFTVTIEDQTGRRSSTEYETIQAQRAKMLDKLGRVRRKPLKRS
jgi:hypothetical protein